MIIDAHSHILSSCDDAEFRQRHIREGSLSIYRSMGLLHSHRMPTEEEWKASGYGSKITSIGPTESVRDHPGFDKIVLLSGSPQFLEGRLVGTMDTSGITGVPGPPHAEKCNDYIAAIVMSDPDKFIGFASVNPNYKGPAEAVKELERAITELGLSGLKLYPMYQYWAPNDRELAFPIYEKAQELGIPVMFHQGGSTRIDAKLELSRPAMLDDVGREFRDLKVIIAHCGWPWYEEALFLLSKHPNFYTEISYAVAALSRRALFHMLYGCEPSFVALEKVFFGTDYPGFLYDPVALRAKVETVNEEAQAVNLPPIPVSKLQGIMGTNFARLLGLEGDPEAEVVA